MKTKRGVLNISLTLAIIFLLSSTIAAKRKDDVIIFKNGDRLTGEIKSLQYGQLYFKNSSMYETVRLDWTQIAKVESKDKYIIELTNGSRLQGLISKAATENQSEMVEISGLKAGSAPIRVSRNDIVQIRPFEGSFLRQLNGSLDAGFSFSQGNKQTNFNLQTSTEYVTQRYSIQTSLDSSFSGQSEAEKTSRIDWTLGSRYFLTRKWFVPGYLNVLTSSEQQLDLRTTFGSGIGRVLKRTDKTNLSAVGGMVVNRERYAPESGVNSRHTEVEGFAAFDGSTFQFDKLEGNAGLIVFSRPGRVRVNFNSNLRWKLVSKLYWKLSFFENFDSSPPTATKKNDFGTSSSIGWKF